MQSNSLINIKNSDSRQSWVRETGFGKWFLSSHTWYKYVLSQAAYDCKRLLKDRIPSSARILDAGCGEGLAFNLLTSIFNPVQVIGVEIDRDLAKKATAKATKHNGSIEVIHGNVCQLPLKSASLDIIFSHQLLHHTNQQTEVLSEFFRLLKPGGILLAGESCRSFINSAPVRLLFRHPKMAQKDAEGYIEIIKRAGFTVQEDDIQATRPWWSRRFFGLAQKCGIGKSGLPATEILLVAIKPDSSTTSP